MPSVDLRALNWISIVLHVVYVWVVGLAIAFFGTVFQLTGSSEFVPILTLLVALATIWAAYRVAVRAGTQPMLHGLMIGLLVGSIGLIMSLLTSPAGVGETDLLGFLLQALGGLIGGRMAQRVLKEVNS